MQCPFDATPLQIVNRSGIEIDWCPSCKGVWLERGELDKLIDHASTTPLPPTPTTPASQHRRPPGDQHDEEHASYVGRRHDWGDDDDDWDDGRHADRSRSRKRKSLLSEIFDF